jgi:hypothetical protein
MLLNYRSLQTDNCLAGGVDDSILFTQLSRLVFVAKQERLYSSMGVIINISRGRQTTETAQSSWHTGCTVFAMRLAFCDGAESIIRDSRAIISIQWSRILH